MIISFLTINVCGHTNQLSHFDTLLTIMAHTACLVCLVSTVSGPCKNALGRGSASIRHITKLEQSTFLYISMGWLFSFVYFFVGRHDGALNSLQGDQIGQFFANWATFGGSL